MKPWIIVPAAGVGARMQADKPKQYMMLSGHAVLWWTLTRLIRAFPEATVIVPLADQDPWWPEVAAHLPDCVIPCLGGEDRAASVLQGLSAAQSLGAEAAHWVLVHDAVRPCVPREDLHALWAQVIETGESALLGAPVVDSLRRVNQDNRITATLDRTNLWRVFTPQVFPCALLYEALSQAAAQGVSVTDESEAVLNLGKPVRSVLGSEQNIKLTYPADLARAQAILQRQTAAEESA